MSLTSLLTLSIVSVYTCLIFIHCVLVSITALSLLEASLRPRIVPCADFERAHCPHVILRQAIFKVDPGD